MEALTVLFETVALLSISSFSMPPTRYLAVIYTLVFLEEDLRLEGIGVPLLSDSDRLLTGRVSRNIKTVYAITVLATSNSSGVSLSVEF